MPQNPNSARAVYFSIIIRLPVADSIFRILINTFAKLEIMRSQSYCHLIFPIILEFFYVSNTIVQSYQGDIRA